VEPNSCCNPFSGFEFPDPSLHSSRLLDVSNRLDPTTSSTLAQYADLIHRNGGATSVPALGALQLFQNNLKSSKNGFLASQFRRMFRFLIRW
jgi:hypothetical protein